MKTFSARETVWLQELDGMELAGFRRRALAFVIDWAIISVILTLVLALGGLGYVGIQRLRGQPVEQLHLDTENSAVTINPDGTPGQPVGSPAAQPAATHSHIHYQVGGLPTDLDTPKNETLGHRLLREVVHILSDVLVPVLYFSFFLWRGNGQTPGKRWMKVRVVSLVHTRISFWHAVERALGYGAAALEAGFGFVQFFIHPYRRCAQDRLAETIVVTERSYQERFPTALGTPPESETLPL